MHLKEASFTIYGRYQSASFLIQCRDGLWAEPCIRFEHQSEWMTWTPHNADHVIPVSLLVRGSELS
jgi:hypothetical protein